MKTTKFSLDGKQKVFCFNVKDEEDTTSQVVELDRVHNLLILDRSGSMTGSMNQLIDNVISAVDEMREQDLISILWFSGVGQREFVVRAKCLYERDKKDIKLLLERLKSTVGLTCFSESFALANQLIEDESVVCQNYNVLFFTDGQPVTPWSSQEEVGKLMSEVDKMKDKVLAINCIGYGYYYDVDLLKAVAERTMFGKYFHNKNVTEYLDVFRNVYEIAKTASLEKIIVESSDVESKIVYLSETFTKISNTNVFEMNANKRKNQFFVISETTPVIKVNGEEITVTETATREATILNFAYAYASELFYNGNTEEAIKVIYQLTKDKSYIDEMVNAFTFVERSSIVEQLKKAVFGKKFKKFRLRTGFCVENYLPADDAFCFLDLIMKLKNSDAYFVPADASEYKRIGAKTVDSFDVFESSKEKPYSSFDNLVFNKEHANLSIRYTIKGNVCLNPKEVKRAGLTFEGNKIPSYKFRNQTIIKDGNRNVDSINAYLDKDVLKEIGKFCQYENLEFAPNIENKDLSNYEMVKIDVSELPIINKLYLNKSSDLKYILEKAIRGNELGVEAKVVKYFIAKIVEERPAVQKKGLFEGMTLEQIDVLKNHGLTEDGAYQGVSRETVQSEDFYESRSLKFDVEGWSSIPKIQDSIDKRASGKKLTDKDILVLKYYDLYDKMGYSIAIKSNVEILENKLSDIKKQDRNIEDELALLRIAKICTNSWWSNLIVESKRGEDYFTFVEDENKLVIKAKKVKVFY